MVEEQKGTGGPAQWVKASGGEVPEKSYKGGKESSGEKLFIARAEKDGGVHPGKVRSAFGGCNIGYGGAEIMVPDYEVLVKFDGKWVKASGGEVPPNAVVGGHEADGTPLYIGQVKYEGGKHIGKVRKEFGGCNFSYGGKELCEPEYRVLMAKTHWVNATGGEVPQDSMVGGNEADGEKLYVGRVNYEGGVHIGKVRGAFGGCNFGWGGEEHCEKEYQVLSKVKGKWVKAEGGEVPEGALHCGREADGALLYLARTEFEGGVHPGKLRTEFGGILVPWGGKEHMMPSYEVFVPKKPVPSSL